MKKFMSIILTVTLLVSMTATVFAGPTIKQPNNAKLSNISGNVLGYVQWFGYALAVGMLLYIGIKYMMASANEKADLKKGAISYVIGAILVIAASSIFGIVVDVAKDVTN